MLPPNDAVWTPVFELPDGDQIVFRRDAWLYTTENEARKAGATGLSNDLRWEGVRWTGRVQAVWAGMDLPRLAGRYQGIPVYVIGGPSMQDATVPSIPETAVLDLSEPRTILQLWTAGNLTSVSLGEHKGRLFLRSTSGVWVPLTKAQRHRLAMALQKHTPPPNCTCGGTTPCPVHGD